jgi:hypothetical protein
LIQGKADIFFTRSGANDPDFNLRRDPALIIRQKGKDHVFVNVLEIHGNHDPVNEFSSNSYPSVQQVQLLHQDAAYTIASFRINGKELVLAQASQDFNAQSKHSVPGIKHSWVGPYTIWYDDKILNQTKSK